MKQLAISSAVVLMSVFGCGGGGGGDLDAPTGDDGIPDAAPSDAALATVTVHVVSPTGGSAVGVRVIFGAGDGSLVADTTTNGLGVATATMAAGGSVTVFEGSWAYTITELPSAATLEVPLYPEYPATLDRTVAWPASSELELYRPRGTCAIAAATTQLLSEVVQQQGNCAHGYDLIVTAIDEQGVFAPAALVARDLAFSGAPTTLPGVFKPMVTIGGQILHRPVETGPLTAFATPLLGLRGVDGVSTANAPGDAFSLQVPQDVDGFEVATLLYHANGTHRAQFVSRVFPPDQTATDLELEGLTMRWPVAGSLAVVDAGQSLRWTDASPGGVTPVDPHVALVTLFLDNGADSYEWLIAVPGSALVRSGDDVMVTVPDVPGSLPFESTTITSQRVDLYRYAAPDVDALRLEVFTQWLRGAARGHDLTGWSFTGPD